MRRLLHWIAHRLGWNACRPYWEFDNHMHIAAWGYECVGCGKVTIVRRYSREQTKENQ